MDLRIEPWRNGWELVACGGGRKLERFGAILLDRPAPQAIWPADPGAPWDDAGAAFQRGEGGTGDWESGPRPAPERWIVPWRELRFELRLTGFGNVGLFPEHAAHWEWAAEAIRTRAAGGGVASGGAVGGGAAGGGAAGGGVAARGGVPAVEVLNLFAYTGGLSLAAAAAGARVTHVDSARAVNAWAAENARRSGLPEGSLRFLADDALKFARREARRGRRYDLIALDPPTFGRGPKGEIWKIERDLPELLDACRPLLSDDAIGLLLTAHSPGVTPAVLRVLLGGWGGRIGDGEMLLAEGRAGAPGRLLPAGAYARWSP